MVAPVSRFEVVSPNETQEVAVVIKRRADEATSFAVTLRDDAHEPIQDAQKANHWRGIRCGLFDLNRWVASGILQTRDPNVDESTEVVPDGTIFDERVQSLDDSIG